MSRYVQRQRGRKEADNEDEEEEEAGEEEEEEEDGGGSGLILVRRLLIGGSKATLAMSLLSCRTPAIVTMAACGNGGVIR